MCVIVRWPRRRKDIKNKKAYDAAIDRISKEKRGILGPENTRKDKKKKEGNQNNDPGNG